MALDPNGIEARYFPDYTTAGGWVPGQVESTGGGYDPNAPGEYKGPVAPSFAGGYYGDQVEPTGGGYDPTTNDSATSLARQAKYADPGNIAPDFRGGYYGEQVEESGGGYDPNASNKPSSMPAEPAPVQPSINGKKDNRVRIKVPASYLVGFAEGPNKELVRAGGIVFPYTPTIETEHKATYNSAPITHANYTQYFYKNSQVGEISIGAKFTVQNETEAAIYVSVVHLFRALTKMRFGDDPNAGSPPPVCRLMAYGDFMFDNTPIAISSFRVSLPDNVDYISTGLKYTKYGVTSVPVMSTFTINAIPIYSRKEMLNGTVDKWLYNDQRLRGYL